MDAAEIVEMKNFDCETRGQSRWAAFGNSTGDHHLYVHQIIFV